MGKEIEIMVADFETTTDPEDCRVWAYGLCPVMEDVGLHDVELGNSIDDFFSAIDWRNSQIYFHNLAFDGSFIMAWLLENGYDHVEEFSKAGQFETLISDTGQHYSITVKWKNGGRTEFRDSFKKIPLSVDRMAKAYHLQHHKLEIDYKAHRTVGHKLTPQEQIYVAVDVLIVAQALWLQISQGMRKMTVGADSLNEFKNIFGRKHFERMFPVIHMAIDNDIRQAYRGGWTYLSPTFKDRLLEIPGSVYDVNSLYPSVMWGQELPYGDPKWFVGNPDRAPYPIYVVSMTFTARLKPDHLPCIQIKGHSIFGETEYVTNIDEPVTLSCTNVDLELWREQYDIDVLSWNGGWCFRKATGIFDEYIHKWMQIKNNETGGIREIAKLHLNSLYGKFATNPNVTGKVPILEDDGVVRLRLGQEEFRDPVYTPIGVMITAYARAVTVRAAQANYGTFAYADTDSMHLMTREAPQAVQVDSSVLGAWKHEYDFVRARFLRSKRYMEQEPNGTMHVHVAGMPRHIAQRLTFDDFQVGKTFGGKLVPRRVPGGIVLEETTFSLT